MRLLKITSLAFLFIFLNYKLGFSEIIFSKTILKNIGDVVIITTDSYRSTKINARVSYNTNLTFPFYFYSNEMISIIPIPAEIKTKKINIHILENNNIIASKEIKLEYIKTLKYKKPRKLKLPKPSETILTNTTKILQDIEYIQNKIKNLNLYYLQGNFLPDFLLPSTNKITSKFGISRKYSDGKVRQHKGIDFSALPDDNVYCAGDGIVIISTNFLANGEAIYIYHGYGIITSYFHLNSRFVNEGDFVKKGEIIGKIGNTGISTAPHLHFGMYILGIGGYIPIDPLSLTSSSKLYKKFISELPTNSYINQNF